MSGGVAQATVPVNPENIFPREQLRLNDVLNKREFTAYECNTPEE
jgi:hypothetical protein